MVTLSYRKGLLFLQFQKSPLPWSILAKFIPRGPGSSFSDIGKKVKMVALLSQSK